MESALEHMNASAWGASAPAPKAPPVLPCSEVTSIDWFDFSQTLNPLGTPESFRAAMHRISQAHRTQAAELAAYKQLPALLAQRYGVDWENVAVGASVTDVLMAAACSFEPRNVAVAVPCRQTYEQCLGSAGHRIVEIPNPDGLSVPDPSAARRMGLAFDAAMLANPAFPTSRLLQRRTLLEYLDACAWVVVDERGIDLTLEGETMVDLVRSRSNLIVVRSLTDAFSLPGLPLSCAIAHPAVARRLQALAKQPTSAMLIAELVKLAATDRHLEATREVLETEIPWMQCMLSLVPGLKIYPAEANWVLCRFKPAKTLQLGAANAADLVQRLQSRGFLVRTLDRTPGIEPGTHFCVAVRTRPENERFIAAIRGILMG